MIKIFLCLGLALSFLKFKRLSRARELGPYFVKDGCAVKESSLPERR